VAAVDPIHFQSVYKIFPGLTLNQSTDMCIYSTGATYKDVGELRDVSPETIKKSLGGTRSKLELQTIQSTSTIFWGRFIVFLSMDAVNDPQLDKKAPPSKRRLNFTRLQTAFPELPRLVLEVVCHFTSGKGIGEISSILRTTEGEVESHLTSSLGLLNVQRLQSLRFIVMARLVENLTLDKLHSLNW